MKRSQLQRKTALSRTTWLRSRPPKQANRTDPARVEWKTAHGGFCECCGRFTLHLERHHIVERSFLVREGRSDVEFDLRNAMSLHPSCHSRHTTATSRIAIEKIPEAALLFAVEVLGEDRAALYIHRYYRNETR